MLGPAYVIEAPGVDTEQKTLDPDQIDGEIQRFQRALEMAVEEVEELATAVRERVDERQAAIFDAHAELIQDPLLVDQTIAGIRKDGLNADYVFWNVVTDVSDRLKAIGDSYMSERSYDLYDVGRRVMKFLGELKGPETGLPEGCIIVADTLGPSDTAQIQKDKIGGFCTNTGGPTSHTAIIAKALSLPAVVGLDFITHYVRTGDFLILDGEEGRVILNPSAEEIDIYRRRSEEFAAKREDFYKLAELPAITLDDVTIRLEANIELTSEMDSVIAQGAEGIGLYRTEYFFIERPTLPSEEEQEAAYRLVLDAMGDKEVVFRTLDVGGDKLANSLATPSEANPFLGLRAIRLCLAFPELFRCQLRPLMRAAGERPLNILLPMVSGVEEIWRSRAIIDQVAADLRGAGEVIPESIRIGAMIEIPSAAIQAERFANEADFFSIGTNDLVQYTLAVDRVNKMVGHLYQELHPAVLYLIRHVIQVCDKTNTPLTVCGEMAGHPQMALLLVGMGVRSLSMSPGLIGPVKQAIRTVEHKALRDMAERLQTLGTAEEVRSALRECLAHASTITS